MKVLPLALALGGVGLFAWAFTRGGSAQVAGDRLVAGQMYRARVVLSPGVYRRMRSEGRRPTEIARFVAQEAKVAGFRSVFLAAEDPSAPGSYTLIGEYGGGTGSNVLRLLSTEEVQRPEGAYIRQWSGPVLDDGLLQEEGEAVIQALRDNRDPKHLSGFASTLSPEFPVAASLLRAKSELCLQLKSAAFDEDVQKKHDRFQTAMGSVGVTIPAFTTGMPTNLRDVLAPLGVDTWTFRYPQSLGFPEAVWFGETCYRLLRSIADGAERVGRARRADLNEEETEEVSALRLTGGALALLPGIGGGAAVAQYVAACYALMGVRFEPMNLGPSYQQAGQLAQVLTKTETLEKVRSELSPRERVRFDVGLIVGETELLRSSSFGKMWHWLPGTDPAEKAAHLKRFMVLARKASRPVREVVLDDIRMGVTDLRVVYEAALMLNSELVKRTAPEVADKLGISPGDARAALASVCEVSEGVRFLAPEVFHALGPNSIARELLPPAAMQLAHATMRPEQSLVSNKEAAIAKARAIHRLAGEGGDAAKAKAQFDRAKRALERQKWVDWMRRKRQADSGADVSGIIRT